MNDVGFARRVGMGGGRREREGRGPVVIQVGALVLYVVKVGVQHHLSETAILGEDDEGEQKHKR